MATISEWARSFPHTVKLERPMTQEQARKVMEATMWLRARFGEPSRNGVWMSLSYIFYFKNAEDAMLFKLTWL